LDILHQAAKPMAKQQTIDFYKEVYRWKGTLDSLKVHA
jgi:hypothetical protein